MYNSLIKFSKMFVLGIIVGCIATVIIEIVGFCYLFIKD